MLRRGVTPLITFERTGSRVGSTGTAGHIEVSIEGLEVEVVEVVGDIPGAGCSGGGTRSAGALAMARIGVRFGGHSPVDWLLLCIPKRLCRGSSKSSPEISSSWVEGVSTCGTCGCGASRWRLRCFLALGGKVVGEDLEATSARAASTAS